jgi:N-acetylneuraminic acid mutarotase
MSEIFPKAYFSISPRKSSHSFSRWGHTAVAMGHQLYCFGGKQPSTKPK